MAISLRIKQSLFDFIKHNSTRLYTVLSFFIFTYLFYATYLKWIDPWTDFGREVYVPWRISLNELLYRDIQYYLGPLSPLFNGLLFKIFGPSIHLLFYVNSAILLLTSITLRKIIFIVSENEFLSFFSIWFFWIVSGFTQYLNTANYNFIGPYSHDATHGFFLLTLLLYLIIAKPFTQLRGAIVGLVLGLLYLTKPEFFFVGASTFALFVFTNYVENRTQLKSIAVTILSFTATLAAVFLYFLIRGNLEIAIRALEGGWYIIFNHTGTHNTFQSATLGVDDWQNNSIRIFQILTFSSIFFKIIFEIDKLSTGKILFKYLIVTLIIFFFDLFFLKQTFFEIFKPLPILFSIFIFYYIFNIRKLNQLGFDKLTLLVFAGLLLSIRTFFRANTFHYGFLMTPFLYISMFLLFDHLKSSYLKNKNLVHYAFFSFVLLIAYHHNSISSEIYSKKIFKISLEKDSFLAFESQSFFVNSTLSMIDKTIDRDDSFLVLPEGILLNYLSKRKTPTPYVDFLPCHFDYFGYETVFNSIKQNHTKWVFLVHRDTSEYGYHFFGTDYAQSLNFWINENFKFVARLGATPFTSNNFGISFSKSNF